MTAAAADCDVLIAGAGLPGLAARVARSLVVGLSVALADRAAVGRPAIAVRTRRTGTPASMRSARAAPHSCARSARGRRLAARSHRAGRGDAHRGRRRRGAQFFGLRPWRARARVDRRGARAARSARSAGARGGRCDPRARGVRGADVLRAMPRCCASASGESIAARLLVGADGARSWVRDAAGLAAQTRPYAQTAVVANFSCERAPPRPRLSVVSRRRRRAGVAAAAGPPGVDRVVGARAACAGAPGARAGRARRARRERGRHALGAFSRDHAKRGVPAAEREARRDHRASRRAGGRRCARRASACRTRRQPGLRRCRGALRGAAASAGRSPTPARRSCSSAMRAGAPSRCSRCTRSPTGSRGCSATRRHGCALRATSAWRGCVPGSFVSLAGCCARAASGHAAAAPSSEMNSRRLMSNVGAPNRSRAITLPQTGRRVLAAT